MNAAKIFNLGAVFVFVASFSMLFQNCSSISNPVGFASQKLNRSAMNGNGDYYDGKPATGSYYRVLPGSKCEAGGNSFLGRIHVSTANIHLERNDPITCKKNIEEIPPHRLEFSYYNLGLIGLDAGIYALTDSSKSTLLTEAWCRVPGSSPTRGLDVVIEHDRQNGIRKSKLVRGNLSHEGLLQVEISPAFQVIGSVEGDNFRYAGEGFSLVLLPRLSSGKTRAHLRHNGIETVLDCRLGGELDPALSPAPVEFLPAAKAAPVPGKIELENYDPGGPGVGYFDTTAGDQSGFNSKGDDVDVFSAEWGLGVDRIEPGEWLKFTIEATQEGTYVVDVGFNSRHGVSDRAFHVEVDGVDVTGTVRLPSTYPEEFPYQRLPALQLSKGVHVVHVVMEGREFRLSHMTWSLAPPR